MQNSGEASRSRRARVVLLAADGVSNTEIAARVGVSRQSVVSWRGRYAADGLRGLSDRARSGRPTRLEPAEVISATLAPPDGRAGWTSRSLGDHLGISGSTVSRIWTKHGIEPILGGVRLRTAPSLELIEAQLIGLWVSGSVGVAAVFTGPSEPASAGIAPAPGGTTADPPSSLLRARFPVTSESAEELTGLARFVRQSQSPETAFLSVGLSRRAAVAASGAQARGLRWHEVSSPETWLSMVDVVDELTARRGGGRLGGQLDGGGELDGGGRGEASHGQEGSDVTWLAPAWSVKRHRTSAPEAVPAPAEKRVTMREVAQRAHVSMKTVSNVLTGTKKVADDTRVRVESAVEELGYQVNTAARQLRTGRSGAVVLAVPELHVTYFAELAEEVIEEADRRDISILVQTTRGRRSREQRTIAAARRRADGTIMIAQGLSEEDLAEARSGGPFVLLGENVQGSAVDRVSISNKDAARTVMSHLVGGGRVRPAVIGVATTSVGQARLEGYREGAAQHGVVLDPALMVRTASWHREEGERAVYELLDRGARFDGAACSNDEVALGALRALRGRGLRVPEDVAVVSFDNSKDAAFATPGLTSIAHELGTLARSALDLIADRLTDGKEAREPVHVTVPHHLVVRESSSWTV